MSDDCIINRVHEKPLWRVIASYIGFIIAAAFWWVVDNKDSLISGIVGGAVVYWLCRIYWR